LSTSSSLDSIESIKSSDSKVNKHIQDAIEHGQAVQDIGEHLIADIATRSEGSNLLVSNEVKMGGEKAHKKRTFIDSNEPSLNEGFAKFSSHDDPMVILNELPVAVRHHYLQLKVEDRDKYLNDYLNNEVQRLPVLKQQIVHQQDTPLKKFEKLQELLYLGNAGST